MINKKIKFLLLICSLVSAHVYGITLEKGKTRSEVEKSLLKSIYQKYQTLPGYLYEISEGQYFSLSKTGNTIGVFNLLDENDVLSGWPLTPWPNAVRMKGEGTNWKVRHIIAGALGGDTTPVTDPNTMILSQEAYQLPAFKEFLGCLALTPLRYGDIDGDNTQELVLILDSDLVVFSPDQAKIIFSTRFADADELAPHEVASWFDGKESDVISQYVAESGVGNRLNAAFPATRSFAKIFLGDFNNDNKKDIVVWRKLYESRLKSDSTLGFQLEAELFVHYQLENGEYQLQTNEPAEDGEFPLDAVQQDQIKGWLTANNLTWQKGFPSKSECVGQEGQLIPEMHDALLNDPDVLK
ncbi:hypothetical protein NBRC116188_22350 [Oceaniserpentilla sp. 4NH20-0058]|uniref:hypothetical protein n=1 Tax=Oceaniserpentilla sp. 4NH20-0058 TaxID=3127660 RepID=UPI003101D982